MRRLFKKKDLDSIFRERLSDAQATPPPHVWQKVEADLSNTPAPHYYLKWAGVAIASLLILGTGLWFAEQSAPQAPEYTSAAALPSAIGTEGFDANVNQIKEQVHGSSILDGENKEILNTEKQINSSLVTVLSRDKNSEASMEPEYIESITGNDDKYIYKSTYLNALLAEHIQTTLASDYPNATTGEFSDAMPSLEEQVVGLHIGSYTAVQNTWVINNLLDQDNLVRTFAARAAYGFNLGYNFSAKTGVEMDFIFSSNEGQSVKTKTELGWENRNIKSNYIRIPVLFKSRMTKVMKYDATPMAINYLVGVQYGRLNWVNIERDINFIQPQDFNQHEWGLLLGIEYDFYLGKNYFITLGGRGGISTDINNFPQIMADNFREPHNLFFGINAKFNYLFKPAE